MNISKFSVIFNCLSVTPYTSRQLLKTPNSMCENSRPLALQTNKGQGNKLDKESTKVSMESTLIHLRWSKCEKTVSKVLNTLLRSFGCNTVTVYQNTVFLTFLKRFIWILPILQKTYFVPWLSLGYEMISIMGNDLSVWPIDLFGRLLQTYFTNFNQ